MVSVTILYIIEHSDNHNCTRAQSKILHMKSSLNVSVIFYTSEEDFIMPLLLKCFKSREDDISTFEDNVIYMVNTKGANILSAIACHWV